MITKKTHIEPSIIEVTVMNQTHLLQNISVKEWDEGNDHNWGGDEPNESDESSQSHESSSPSNRKEPFHVLWTDF